MSDIPFEKIVGKTIKEIIFGRVPSEFGHDDCVTLIFTDGTQHGFVLPTDGIDEDEE